MNRAIQAIILVVVFIFMAGCSSGQEGEKVLKFKEGDIVIHKTNQAKGIVLNLHKSKLFDSDYQVRFAKTPNTEGIMFAEIDVREFEIEAPPVEKETTK